jgi:hypothetical protein
MIHQKNEGKQLQWSMEAFVFSVNMGELKNSKKSNKTNKQTYIQREK